MRTLRFLGTLILFGTVTSQCTKQSKVLTDTLGDTTGDIVSTAVDSLLVIDSTAIDSTMSDSVFAETEIKSP